MEYFRGSGGNKIKDNKIKIKTNEKNWHFYVIFYLTITDLFLVNS